MSNIFQRKSAIQALIPSLNVCPRAKSAQAKTTKSKSAQTAAVMPSLSNLEEAIRLRAYEIYLQRGCQPGNPHEDWAVAERKIRRYVDQNTDAQA